MNSNKKWLTKIIEIFNRTYFGNTLGIIIASCVSMLAILLSLPFTKWIKIINMDTLYTTFKLNEEVINGLEPSYSIFNILSFIQDSKVGSNGMYAMILLILMIAGLYFHGVFLFRVIGKKKNQTNNLSLYSVAQIGMAFSVILSIATIHFVSYSNKKYGLDGFQLSPVVFFVLVISLMAFLVIKLAEVKERHIYKEYGFLHELKKNWVLFAMLIPTFIYLTINNYLPMLGIYYAFTSFNFRDGLWESPFTGFKNFEHLFKANLFTLTKNTILYNIVFIGVGNVLQVIFAIFVSRITSKWFKRSSQTLMLMPYFVSFVILKVLVYNLLEYQSGLINTTLISFGLDRIDFYNTPSYWPYLITFAYLWKGLGYGMVIYLATIMGISTEYYEAATVDGANVFQQIRYITLPLIKPTFIILLLFALGSIMKGQFELFYQMIGNNGVLYATTDIFDTFVYRITTTQPLNIGIGTAAGLYQSVFGFIVIMITNFLVKRKHPEYGLF